MSYYRPYCEKAASASVTIQDGMLLLVSSYNRELVAWLNTLPRQDRRCNYDTDKSWVIDPRHGADLKSAIKRCMGLEVEIPQVQAVEQGERVMTFEVRYLGGARQHGGEVERTATGWVNGEWLVIFGEIALRQWAGEHDVKPGGVLTKYGVLGIPQEATADEIKSAYRKMVRVTHPDVCREPDAAQRFRQVQESYEILSDPILRQKYDAGLRLQALVSPKERVSTQSVYYSPLRCGMITARVKPIAGGRYLVSEILDWKDIIQNGKMLVSTWANGEKMFIEQWVEATP